MVSIVRTQRKSKHNRIWLISGAVLAMLLSLYSIRSAFVSVVALEQTARCGAEEHIHTAQCYADGVLRCEKPAHTHNRNCYLVLLQDNDINALLSRVEEESDHSLERLIYRTVDTAQTRTLASGDSGGGENETGPPGETSLLDADLSALNTAISGDEDSSGIVLNENLYDAATLSSSPGDTVALLGTVETSGGVSTLSVGDTAQTGNNNANFYVHLDDDWVCIGTLEFSVFRSSNRYTARLETTDVVDLINDSLDTAFTYNSFELSYAASENANSWSWSDAAIGTTYTTFGTDYWQQNSARAAKYVHIVGGNGDPISFYTVTYEYPDGSTDYEYVQSGSSVTLPGGYDWTSSVNGNTYTGGQSVTITGTTTFSSYVDDGSMRVSYTVNFPTSVSGFSNAVTMPVSPTLEGTTQTTLQDRIEADTGTVVRDVSLREVRATTAHQAQFRYVFLFSGWQTEGGDTLSPNNNLSWEELQAYDADNDGTVELEGTWLHGTPTVANFCVRYDSKTGQGDTSSSKYTPSIYTTYVGGGGDLSLEGISDEDAYKVDQQIRALHGSWSGDVWLYSFPSDEYVFEQLKNYTSQLTVEDEEVNAADLNSDQYAIRWYKIFEDGADGWHIDGRLVKKEGRITVDKEFFGEDAIIHQAEDGFYITAVNGTYSNGVFTPYQYGDAAFKQYVLVMNETDKAALQSTYPNATEFHVYDSTADFSDGEGYEWRIEGVELGEYWQIEEHPVDLSADNYIYYAEYSVYDTDGVTSALAEYGTTASVVGKTFALDEDPDQGLLVDFRNYYYPTESILIKKEDADTGQPIGGAAFELFQESDGGLHQLKFSYNSTTNQYTYDNNGAITRITTGAEGFTAITTTGFSYSHGPVTVKEVISPTGYAAAPNVTLTEGSDGTVSITGMAYENGTAVESTEWADFAEVRENGGVLIVRNHSTALTAVTANKVWADGTAADSVTLVLQANDTTATNLFPGLSNVRAVLNAANGWTYTWTGLPTYANGAPVTWSVKEILVGAETTLSDGVSFANWTVAYSPPTRTDTDADGITDQWSYTVTNSVRRAQLYVVKTDGGGSALAGAVFELVEVDSGGTPVSGAVYRTGTTDSSGLLQFDNLKYTTRYRLVETAAPSGYEGYTTPAYLTLAADGTVTVESHSHVTAGANPYVARVVNYQPLPLPETGGSGPGTFYWWGGALLLLTAFGYFLPTIKKKGRYRSG